MNPGNIRRQCKFLIHASQYIRVGILLCFLFQYICSSAKQKNFHSSAFLFPVNDTIIISKDTVRSDAKQSMLLIPNNIVFLLDISNSMARDKKMQLLHKSMRALLLNLKPVDRIHLITFGNTVNEVYSTTSLTTPDSLSRILEKIRSTASATNINGGIQVSYDVIQKYFIKNGNNEVMIITDGEFALNKFTIERVRTHPEICLTAVIVGKGSVSERAVEYIKKTLQLPVVTLIDEALDTEQLLNHIKEMEGKRVIKQP